MIYSKLTSLLALGSIFVGGALVKSDAVAAPAATPIITSLSAISADRSGYVEIKGTGFGTTDGVALIGGLPAPLGTWQDTRIVAWVPEAAALGSTTVQVTNSTGQTSNGVALTVTARQVSGKAKWRFRQNGPYSKVRPVIAPDGTIYSVDVYSHLYALTPDGALKWVARGAGTQGVAVGPDGTVYAGSESAVKAYSPDGTLKWTFVQNPIALFFIGLSVGPDGNIYAVATSGIGAFSLTPQGTLRWAVPEPYDARTPVPYGEIVFGPSGSKTQMYFYANSHIRAFGLDGKLAFTINIAAQPVIGPEGNIHVPYGAYSPVDGHLVWVFSSQYPYNVSDTPDVGSNNIHYTVQNTVEVFALSSTGIQIWHRTLNDVVGGPVVDPQNTQLIVGGVQFFGEPGYVISESALDGHELWRVNLPAEDGFNQSSDTRARFAPDGLTAYIMTFTATGNNDTSASFLYALDTTATTTLPTLKSTKITLTARSSGTSVNATSKVTVTDGNGAAVSGATVAVTWKLPSGQTLNQSVATNARGLAVFNATDVAGTYTINVTNITKTGYTFDSANSVLTKSARSR
ncbi:MAG TPA: IPT/TIG domain-containing protein [Chthoniobacterales bacterium]|nr:IPT/TIG domain-containing protein [Chthoniobacterales bacterium]